MNIGIAAKLSNLPAKIIRYYESVRIIFPVTPTETDVQPLRFIQRARNLGFSVKDTSKLLSLWRNTHRTSADVKALAVEHINRIEKNSVSMRQL